MKREWRPGDVAMVTYRLGQCTETNVCAKAEKGWDCLAPGVGFLLHSDVIDARPLVVIDAEDREQVTRLCKEWFGEDGWHLSEVGNMQEALRSLIEPPRPEVYEHLAVGGARPYGDTVTLNSICGKSWTPNDRSKVNVIGRCPDCTEAAKEWVA